MLTSVIDDLKSGEKENTSGSRIVNFINSCLRNNDAVKFIVEDESGIKDQITSVVEVLLKGICLLQKGNSTIG